MTVPAAEEASSGLVDLRDGALMRDPAAGFSRVRERCPLARGAIPGVAPAWLATRYDDVRLVLGDPRFVNDPANVPGLDAPSLSRQILRSSDIPAEYLKYRMARMGLYDGAEHARLRGLVSRAFTVRRVMELRPRVEKVAEELLDDLPGKARDGTVDLLGDFGDLLPRRVMWELLGIPDADRPRWERWCTIVIPGHGDKTEIWRQAVDYTRELIERRREKPAGDLTTALIRAQDEDGDRLSDVEMIAMIVMLGLSNPQTTGTFIANGVLALLTHPGQLALLRRDPGLMPAAVEELLRWCGPSLMTPRMRHATEDVEVGGARIRRGEAVWPMLVAANHDPRRFDDPARLDLTREPHRRRATHVAFGGGPHICLGAAQARQDAEVAFTALLRRFPGLALAADPGDIERDPATQPFQWRLASLPVRL